MPRSANRPPADWMGSSDPARFDVRAFARTAIGSHRGSLPLKAFATAGLTSETLAALAYLRDLERATMSRLRDVLVTPTHKDARVTAFLTTWAFEKFWIADALTAVLQAHGDTSSGWDGERPGHGIVGPLLERFRPIGTAITANLIGPDIVTSHLVEGTVDEWLVQGLYRDVVARHPHPELAELVDTVLAVKDRHLVFFEQETRRRLAESRAARVLARRALRRTPFPIGSEWLDPDRSIGVLAEILSPDDAADVDARVDRLPGLTGTRPVGRSRSRLHASGRSTARTLGLSVGRAASSVRRGSL